MPIASTKSPKGLDPVAFGADIASVVAFLCWRIAAGGREGRKEARLMVSEKIAAFTHVQWGILSGAYGYTPQSILQGVGQHYTRAVRTNRERLSPSSER